MLNSWIIILLIWIIILLVAFTVVLKGVISVNDTLKDINRKNKQAFEGYKVDLGKKGVKIGREKRKLERDLAVCKKNKLKLEKKLQKAGLI